MNVQHLLFEEEFGDRGTYLIVLSPVPGIVGSSGTNSYSAWKYIIILLYGRPPSLLVTSEWRKFSRLTNILIIIII